MQLLSTVVVGLVALLSAMLAGHVALSPGDRPRALLLVFFLLFALQASLLIAHMILPGVIPLGWRAVVGAAIPPSLFLFFARRESTGAHRMKPADALHAWPSMAIALCLWADRSWSGPAVDGVIMSAECIYGLALLSLDRGKWRDAPMHWGLKLAAGFLLAALLIDAVIALEIAQGTALTASWGLQIGVAVMAALIMLAFGWAWRDPEWLAHLLGELGETIAGEVTVTASFERPNALTADANVAANLDQDRLLCERLQALVNEQHGVAEFGLTLTRSARRLGVSAKRLSQAVNAVHGRGFRTLINDWKVESAARLLRDPALGQRSVLDIMFDSGFQTKSSFNKEFAARIGMAPTDYRLCHLPSLNTDQEQK